MKPQKIWSSSWQRGDQSPGGSCDTSAARDPLVPAAGAGERRETRKGDPSPAAKPNRTLDPSIFPPRLEADVRSRHQPFSMAGGFN